jgi:hypothetical protein
MNISFDYDVLTSENKKELFEKKAVMYIISSAQDKTTLKEGVDHYTKDGKLYTGPTHKDADCKLMTGAEHSSDSQYLYHKEDL